MYRIQQSLTAAAFVGGLALFSPTLTAQIPPRPVALTATLNEAPGVPKAQSTPVSGVTSGLKQEELGDLLVVRRRYVDAINAYQGIAGNSPVIWNKLGIAYQHMFNIKAARASYEHALRLDPNYPEALNNLGTVMYGEKDYKGAARYYVKALKLSPRSAIIYSNLGTAQFARGDYKRGVKAYREAFSIDPAVFEKKSGNEIQESGSREARAMLNFNLAKFYARARMNERALACLRQALDNGFRDRKKLMGDEELAELRQTQGFRLLLTEQGLR